MYTCISLLLSSSLLIRGSVNMSIGFCIVVLVLLLLSIAPPPGGPAHAPSPFPRPRRGPWAALLV